MLPWRLSPMGEIIDCFELQRLSTDNVSLPIYCNKYLQYRPCPSCPFPSFAPSFGEVEKAMRVPLGACTCEKEFTPPLSKAFLQASIITIFTLPEFVLRIPKISVSLRSIVPLHIYLSEVFDNLLVLNSSPFKLKAMSCIVNMEAS